MNKQDIRNSISLIGPSCVGKSLIAFELSQKVSMPIICIDDLLVMIEYEKSGQLSKDKEVQKRFIKTCVEELKSDPSFQKVLRNEALKKREIKLLKDILKLYNSYFKLFGSLKPFYEILERYQEKMYIASMPEDNLLNLNIVTMEILVKVLKIVNCPVIFDLPASFGCDIANEKNLGDLNRYYKIDFNEINMFIQSFLNTTSTVALCPGLDYEKRNSVKTSVENKMLLENSNKYLDNAKVSITTNAVFYNPENKFFKRRSWLDAEESLVKDKLKNKGEISNIVDEILMRIEELNLQQE